MTLKPGLGFTGTVPGGHRRELTLSPASRIVTCVGGCRCHRLVKHIAAAPYRFDVVIAACRLGELFAQLADENINDLELGLVHSAIEVVEKHFPRDDGALLQGKEFEDGVLLAGQVQRLIVDRDNSGIEINGQLTRPGRRFAVAFGEPNDRLNGNWMSCFDLGQATALYTESEAMARRRTSNWADPARLLC